jgi:hypothetical protein
MSTLPSTRTGELARHITSLRARLRVLEQAEQIRLGELKTIAAHARQAKQVAEGAHTVANRVYAHGAIAERGGYLNIDDYALAGLEAHGDLYALWIATTAAANPSSDRGGLLRIIFADPRRHAWCRAEGARLAWEFAKAAREKETALFHARQARGSKHWRKNAVTEFQFYMISLIEVRGGFRAPNNLNCGRAHDWIAQVGGHPDFWAPPAGPPAFDI